MCAVGEVDSFVRESGGNSTANTLPNNYQDNATVKTIVKTMHHAQNVINNMSFVIILMCQAMVCTLTDCEVIGDELVLTHAKAVAMMKKQLDALAETPGLQGVMLTFDDFLIGMDQFGTRIQPLMQCRRHVTQAAA